MLLYSACTVDPAVFYVSQTVVVETEVSVGSWHCSTLCGLEIFENVAYTMSAITEIDKWVEWEAS